MVGLAGGGGPQSMGPESPPSPQAMRWQGKAATAADGCRQPETLNEFRRESPATRPIPNGFMASPPLREFRGSSRYGTASLSSPAKR